MGYIHLSAVRPAVDAGIRRVLTSYYIWCQFVVHIIERVREAPEHLRIDIEALDKFTGAIPNFHIYGHKSDCMRYSLHYQVGVGQTVAEVVESNWSITNPLSGATACMSEGARLDCLDDHFSDSNWQKTVNIGERTSYHFSMTQN